MSLETRLIDLASAIGADVKTLTTTKVSAADLAAVATGTNTGDQVIPTTLPASDVYAWAKADTKPTYTATEVGLGNVPNLAFSGTNTGDETTATIKTKLDITTLSGNNTGDQDLSGKQDTLVSGTNIRTVNGNSLLGSTDIVTGDVTLTGTETLTNKTLTSPVLTSPALGTPVSGDLTSCTADGANAIGYKAIPQNSQSAAYSLVLSDAGKHILHPSADTTARTFTIPANSSVAYDVGTAITFVNQASAGVMTIAITTDTMRLAGAGTTGSRTLAANGVATALKVAATEWIISGSGLT